MASAGLDLYPQNKHILGSIYKCSEQGTILLCFLGRRSVTSTTSSSTQLSPPAMKGDEYAYIPYTYAKNTIAKIMDDMKRMKNNHIQIVYDIELAYKGIEDETQVSAIV